MREYQSPAVFTVDPTSSCADIAAEVAAADPGRKVFSRRDSSGHWQPITARELLTRVIATAKGLIANDVQPGDRVALLSATRWEWPVLDLAIWAAGAVTVPIYDSSSADQVAWILEDSGAVALVVENDAHREIAEDALSSAPGAAVRKIFQIDGPDGADGALAELAAAGAQVPDEQQQQRSDALCADDPATLIYTSGTTGRPKGCMLTHANLLSEIAGVANSGLRPWLQPGRKTLMFLPMAHALARAVTLIALSEGVTVGFTSDTRNIVSEFASFRPTFILSVPRVFEKVYATARANAESGGRVAVFDAAAGTAIAYSEAADSGRIGLGLKVKHAIFDRLVYSKLRSALGGECELAISGGAPLGARLAHFYRGVGIPVYEGYGLTETCAAFSVNTPGETRIGSVGKPLSGNTARIAEDGELMLSGAVVFDGYWQNPEASAEAMSDGWFHTGDLGAIDEDGYLSITGRKKELIVTAGGKNVSPAGLEDVLRADPLVSQAVVVGDHRPFIGALITIDAEAFDHWKGKAHKDTDATVADLVEDDDLRSAIQSAVDAANRTVSHAEGIKRFRILPDDFSEESGEMTPTLKVKRNVVAEKFADDIEALYTK